MQHDIGESPRRERDDGSLREERFHGYQPEPLVHGGHDERGHLAIQLRQLGLRQERMPAQSVTDAKRRGQRPGLVLHAAHADDDVEGGGAPHQRQRA